MLSVEAATRDHGAVAEESILKELRQMLDKGVLRAVREGDLSTEDRRNTIRSLLFLKEKFTPSGAFEKLKARLVANGAQQDREVYDNSSSPTASIPALFMVFAIAAKEGRHVASADIGGAYLNADIEKGPLFMRVSRNLVKYFLKLDPNLSEFACEDGTLLFQIVKAMYGTVEAGRLWYEDMSATLERDGFKRNEHERCVFNKTIGGVQVTVLLYVDDLVITSAKKSLVEAVIEMLTEKYKQVTFNIGDIHDYLGMVFEMSGEGRAKVSMIEYLKNVLKFAEIDGTAATPATSKLFEVSDDAAKLNRKEAKKFHTIVAKLLYMSKRTRIDIMTAVSFLCTRVREPTVEDLAKLTRVLKYLNGTIDHYIILSISDDLKVIVYVDASFGIHMDGKGHTGIFITLGIGPIYCRSSKQKSVSASTSEAELITLGEAYPIILWVR
ncbi:unnamed protein product, partial [Ectocarpus fasciculatus]